MSGKHFVVIVNPRGGTRCGLAVLDEIKPVFETAGAALDVRVTAHPGHAREIAKTADLVGCDGLCVIGGDGTIHEAVGGLMQRDVRVSVPLGVIPGGSGNSMHQHLHCTDPHEAARRIVAGRTQQLDVVRVTMGDGIDYCVNIVGWAAVVDINRAAERLRILGPIRYTLAAILHILRARRRRAKLVLDDKILEDEFLLVAACNTKFTGKGMQLAPKAEIDDGLLDVVLVRRASRLQMMKLFSRVFDGSHVALSCVEYHQVRSIRIEPENSDTLNLDGEIAGSTPVSAEVLPAALRIFA